MRTTLKPFWSFQIDRTEEWLSSMEKKGLRMRKQVGPFFTFDEAEGQRQSYRILYKEGLTGRLKDGGWEPRNVNRRWTFVSTSLSEEEIEFYPGRDTLLSRNRKLLWGLGVPLAYALLMSIVAVFLFLNDWISGREVYIEGSPYWAVTISIAVCSWTVLPYLFISLRRSSMRMGGESPYDRSGRNTRIAQGNISRRWKFGWQYAPDKLEQWLESMDERGYELHRVSCLGLCYTFVERGNERIKYVVDYQKGNAYGYAQSHREAGWTELYRLRSTLGFWTIWAQQYEEEAPAFYSNSTDILQHAKQVATIHASIFGCLAFLYTVLIMMNVTSFDRNGPDLLLLVIFVIVAVEFAALGSMSLLYYRRVRKRVKLEGDSIL
ncbi:hypothetical protein N781_04800 [Pontibacillus halophilus JSM 076056 = DSM 19796]|uniref:DUF2812 domain-containing protein n=1 Tax=Pontibacillus halophilus JSM 076056 = DSM 19796 TaxID=1385510 RepID=A0A0A5GHB0_9BACI|nr:DUF2812 domain-containing protein [Pontibacillus halophilus]KGX91414.1 hypothetical protein N781_04800 [Pontibacillus halophilus JSM 076056 = DSM 19796]